MLVPYEDDATIQKEGMIRESSEESAAEDAHKDGISVRGLNAAYHYSFKLAGQFRLPRVVKHGEELTKACNVGLGIPKMTRRNWGDYTRAKRTRAFILENKAKRWDLIEIVVAKVREDEAVMNIEREMAGTAGPGEDQAFTETEADNEKNQATAPTIVEALGELVLADKDGTVRTIKPAV